MEGFITHLNGEGHGPPFRCGYCAYSYLHRRTLYQHLRNHHQPSPVNSGPGPSTYSQTTARPNTFHSDKSLSTVSDGPVLQEPVFDFGSPIEPEESVPDEDVASSLLSAAERSVLKLRSVSYMTNVAIQAVNEQCHNLMQDTASLLKQKVLKFLATPEQERNIDQLSQEFSISNPFENLKTKSQQLACFQKKYGLLPPKEIYLRDTFVSRQHPKRPRLEPTQIHQSYQYVSIIDILQGVLRDPYLRKLILSEKPSSDGLLRSFRDGALFETLPPDLKSAIRVIIYVDDLEVLQALSSKAGAYKVAGIYFGIQNLPAELNSLLNYIFVTALAYADDAKRQEVWELFLSDMRKLETEGFDIVIDGQTYNFRAVLVAQIGDTLAAHEVLGFVSPSCNAFCRYCYITRKEMWADGLKVGPLRTPAQHNEDIRGCNNVVIRRATGVRGAPLLHGLRFFNCVKSSVPDIFHDLNQGVCKMEVKLAFREYVCKKKYLTAQELNSRIQFFDYGFVDKKNKPSPNFTFANLNDIKTYNLHQTGAQMWCLVRVFPFLLSDLIPDGDNHFKLICLLNQIMTIVFAHAHSEYNLQELNELIHEHHALFQNMYPGDLLETSQAAHEQEMEVQVELENSFENPDDPEVINQENLEEVELPEEEFHDEESVPLDEEIEVIDIPEVESVSTEKGSTSQTAAKKPKVVRMINKHHHMLHFVDFIRNFGPLINYWCIRYEAKHYFFKLCATVCHNFKNILKTLMEILQMKIASDKLKPSNRLTIGKRGREIMYVSEAPHRHQLSAFGLQPGNKINKVNSVVLKGVDYRPELFIIEKLRTQTTLPVFAQIEAVYVSSCEEHVYLLIQEWCTVKYDARLCAYYVTPSQTSLITVKEVIMFPSYRLLSPWRTYGSDVVYLAPRTIS
ncbi:Zinc finger protein 814 [Frankliniella fusca]|uniref:Zinc finger protein 814 n=1 Tax=Frankliniella fusca TaxID=407009 RepID=A0AAE1HDA9_9NEOP|nr:Zinc finger protein 814 [Frankliniella fusca]